MKAFEFNQYITQSYARFSRSFSTVRAEDIRVQIAREYDDGRFWPDALLSLNPRFLAGPTVDDLVASGDLDEATAGSSGLEPPLSGFTGIRLRHCKGTVTPEFRCHHWHWFGQIDVLLRAHR